MKSNRFVSLFQTLNNRKYLVAMSIIFGTLIVDVLLIKLSNLLIREQESTWRIPIFTIVAIIYMVGQYIILEYVKQKSEEIRRRKQLPINVLHKIVTIVQYSLTAVIAVVILQVTIGSYYITFAITTATAISYGLTIGMMILLSVRFFSWFKSNRNYTVFFYGLSSISITINAIFSVIFISTISLSWPSIIRPFYASSTSYLNAGSVSDILSSATSLSSVISFMLTWIATAMLLYHHSHKLGKAKYWIIIGIPLVYFLSQFITLFLNLFAPLLQSIFIGILLTLIFTLSKPVGGLLFGVAFYAMAKNVSRNSAVRDYLIISAYGFVLLFISNQASSLIYHPYPPFGLVTISFMGVSSYLILIGIYSSAISVSQDSKLRQSIHKLAIKESKLLDSIGTAQMELEIQRRVIKITKENQDRMTEESGFKSSLDEDDIKQYLEQVLREKERSKRD